ncbi:MAG: hypothetical protein J6S69_01190, partial [Proteobacteria bacterium]|nr:hypothetical protein [Pseudomonadota bacterium]
LDCIAIDDSSCLPEVPPPAPGCDVPPPAPGCDVPPPAPGCDVPPPAPGCDVPPPAPGSAMGKELDKGASKSSISFAVQAETLSVSENVQTYEMNQETPDTNGRFYLNSDISVIPDVSETTNISAEFALADTGVVPVPDVSAEFEGEDEDCDKTAAYDRPAFLDAFVSADELKDAVLPGVADLPASEACADRDVAKSEKPVESEPKASDEEIDDTMIAPSRPVQQDTSAGLKAVPLRTLSQLSFGQSLAVSSNIQAQKQNSHALLENVENTPDTKGELKSKLSDGKADKGLDAKTLEASDAKDEAANARTVAQRAKPAASQSHENNKAASSSSEARKVSPGDQIVEALPEPESEVSEAKTFSLGQVVTIIVLFLVIIFLILFLIYSLFIKSPVIV